MKKLIKAELAKQYPGLPKDFLGTIAEKIAPKVTDESQIEGAIAELNKGFLTITDLAAEWQREGDRRATEAVNSYKTKTPAESTTTVQTPTDTESPLEKQIREMQAKLAAMEAKETQQTVRQTLLAQLKAKGIPEAMAKNIQVNADANIEEVVNGIEADYLEIKQGLVTDGLKQNSFIPGGGNGTPSQQSILSDIDKWVGSSETAK